MVVLEYCAKHNMIAYLKRIEENAQFHEIVDFLSRSSIFYALTVSLDVCASFIEQFWKTATFKTINNISQTNAKVVGKPVLITEASIRSDLIFNDVDGIDCLTNKGIGGSGGDQVKLPHDSPLSGGHTSDRAEGSLNLEELSALCTNLSNRVLALETIKDAQDKEILILKARIKNLEKRCKTIISHHRAWLRSVSFLSKKKKLSKRESVEGERHGEEQASMNYIANLYDEVQARIDADHELAVKLTHEEQEKFTHSQLNKKSFEDIQGLYMKEQELIADFIPIGFEEDERRIRDMSKKAEEESSNKGVDSTKKRKAGSRMKRMSTRQKTDVDLKEEEKLKTFMKIVPDEKGIIDYEVLDKRFPIINWESKFYHYDRHGAEGIYYRIFKSDGSSRWIKTFSEMGDLRTMFEANAEDELWQNQEEWSLKSWNFYENYGVHILILEYGTEIHMLAERRYPLTTRTLEKMLSLTLIAESASNAAYDLLRFIQKQIDESVGYDRGEKDL
nr:ribonuclease H-like domain, reverse transcriptase, RNA-dependent DNA polymerase [Tanacetum cinerariifolium]